LIDHIRKNKRYSLTRLLNENRGQVTLGRLDNGATIEVGWEDGTLIDMTMDISRTHATITATGDIPYITDGGSRGNSRHGTFVNGKRLTDAGHLLKNGDEIFLGEYYGPLETKVVDIPAKEHLTQ